MIFFTSDADLQNCIYFDQEIEVWFDGEIDMVGRIVTYTEDTVQMNDGYYLRANCYFKAKAS